MIRRLIRALTGKQRHEVSSEHQSIEQDEQQAHVAKLITAYDAYGREMQITRSDWRDKVLLPQIQAQWNDPEELYSLIVNALHDEFFPELDEASRRLVELDPIIERSHVTRAIVLMKLGSLNEAERILLDAVAKTGETGTILTNLAKVQDERGELQQADATLWKSLTLEPNQDNGLDWWLARERDRGGDAGYRVALDKVSELPGSWRAKLYQAFNMITANDTDAALKLYEEALELSDQHQDALLAISGDLGNAGKIAELVELVAPRYNPSVHGPLIGVNLLQAYLHLGQLDKGEELLDRVYALNYTPFKQKLDTIAAKYQERRHASTESTRVDDSQLEVRQVPFELPIWMYGLRNPEWLFKPKSVRARSITFLALGKKADDIGQPELQREDTLGRLSRAIPLYLAESVYEWTPLHVQAQIAVVVDGGLVVFRAGDEERESNVAARFASHTDILVQGSISDQDGSWAIDVGIWDTARAELIGRESVRTDQTSLEAAVLDLEGKILGRLGEEETRPHDDIYSRPSLEQMEPYLDALAQSLLLCLTANGIVPSASLWGERNLLERPLLMALHWPDYEVPKAMYCSGISHAARYHSKVLGQFEERSMSLLQDMAALGSPLAQLGPLILHAFKRKEALNTVRRDTKDPRILDWIGRVTARTATESIRSSHEN